MTKKNQSNEWKEEYLPRLKNSLLYKQLVTNCRSKDSEVITTVDNAISYSCQRTKTIIQHLGEYTFHQVDHLFKVLELMERLITNENIKNLSTPELILLILSVSFHDINSTSLIFCHGFLFFLRISFVEVPTCCLSPGLIKKILSCPSTVMFIASLDF